MSATTIDYGPILDTLERDGAAVLDPELEFFSQREWDEIERLSLRDAGPKGRRPGRADTATLAE